MLLGCDGEVVASYRKMHIPDDPGFYEKYYFTPGDPGTAAEDVDHLMFLPEEYRK